MAKETTTAAVGLPIPKGLADGVYLDLDEETYHTDPALGSTDVNTLIKGANRYWTRSCFNPKRAPVMKPMTDALVLGKAMHALLLEGEKAFKPVYIRRPDDLPSDSPADKGKTTKAAKAGLRDGQFLLHGEEYDWCLGVRAVIDQDPELKGCLDNGLSEVSVFWTREDGVRCKARIDKLKLRGMGDLKSIANEREEDLQTAARWRFENARHDVQAAHYLEARSKIPAFVTAGNVFVGPAIANEAYPPHAGPLKFLADLAKTFAFQIIYVDKSEEDVFSFVLSPGNPIIDAARLDIEYAVHVYKQALARFGLKERWLPLRPVAELDVSELSMRFGRRAS